jgi:cytochrome c oxidase subunit IV
MSEHVVPIRLYVAVFVALLVLTFVTVEIAGHDLGEPELLGMRIPLNVIVALAIACTKASLVVIFFMHVRWASRLTWLVVASGFVFLAILFLITFADYFTRGWLGNPGT